MSLDGAGWAPDVEGSIVMQTSARTLAIVLAGGQGSRLHELTTQIGKPAVAFAGDHRIIDWTIASLARAQVDRVAVALDYRPKVLRRHLAKRWRPVLHATGLDLVQGPEGAAGSGGFHGTADAVRQILRGPEVQGFEEVLVLAAGHIHDIAYDALLAAHRGAGAVASVACHRVPSDEVGELTALDIGTGGHVKGLGEVSTSAAGAGDAGLTCVGLGAYVFSVPWLRQAFVAADPDGTRALDLDRDILPLAVGSGDLFAPAAMGQTGALYWRDVGTLDAYRAAQVEFAFAQPCALPDARMPRPAQLWADDRGNVRMPGAMVAHGARLTNTIAAPGVAIGAGMVIGEDPDEDRRWFRVTEADTRLVTAEMVVRRTEARARQYWMREMRAPGTKGTRKVGNFMP